MLKHAVEHLDPSKELSSPICNYFHQEVKSCLVNNYGSGKLDYE
jgi:hypothetical protein